MHKTWKWKLAGAVAALAVAGSAPQARAALCGDLDNNGQVAINDVVLHLNNVASPPPTLCGGLGYGQCADMDGDGANQVADTVLLLKKVSGIANCNPDTCIAKTILAGCPGGGAGSATLSGTITGNVHVTAGCAAHVHGITFVDSGAILTVDAGVTVLGDVDVLSALIVKPGGRINAVGGPTTPIVWTSANPVGSRVRSDWGGVSVLGKAPVNQPNITLEGLPPSPDLLYGGSNPDDFSGCMKYNRVEFSGREFTPDNELNTITLCGVGRKTQLSFLQAHKGFDDCIEWFGGTVNGDHFVSSACGDDGFDTQLGTSGALQFGLVVDQAESIESPGSNGYEQDNSEFGFNNTPFNNPKYCNTTIIGTRYSAANPTVQNSFGILSRRGNAMTIANSIITHWRGGGYTERDPETSVHSCVDQNTLNTVAPVGQFINTIFEDNGPGGTGTAIDDSSCPHHKCAGGANVGVNCSVDSECPASTCAKQGNCNCSSTEHLKLLKASKGVIETADATIDNIGGKVFPPAGGSLNPPAGSLAATAARADCTTIDSSFVNVPYIGGFEPGGTDWTVGWTDYPAN